MSVNLQVFGSTSSGNATIIWDDISAILIDIGFGKKYMRKHLKDLGFAASDIDAVFITHGHRDHINKYSLNWFLEEKVPVYCHEDALRTINSNHRYTLDNLSMTSLLSINSRPVDAGNFLVTAFSVPHDSPGGCSGYNIYCSSGDQIKKISFATDIGFAGEDLVENFKDSDVIVLESNHDDNMLYNSGRPRILIDRIKEIGHLSNEEASEFLGKVLESSTVLPQAVVLAHISQQCNTNALAVNAFKKILRDEYEGIQIVETYKNAPNRIITI